MAKNRAFGSIQRDRNKTSFFKILADEDLSSESMVVVFLTSSSPFKNLFFFSWSEMLKGGIFILSCLMGLMEHRFESV